MKSHCLKFMAGFTPNVSSRRISAEPIPNLNPPAHAHEALFGIMCTILIIVVLCVSVARANTSPDSPVVSAAEIDFPPFSIVDEDGRASGFAVELMQAALQAMGREVAFRTGAWHEVRGWLEKGEVQALPLVGRTPEREHLFDFTFPYMSLHGAIVVREDETGIEDLNDLVGKQVAVMKGDNAEEFLRREDRGIRIHITATFEQALKELSEGKHDAVVVQRLVALRLIQEAGLTNLRVINRPIEDFRQDFCFAVREGDREMLALLNEGLALVMADGTYRYLHHKWFASLELPSYRLIVVGGDHNYPPYEYLDENGQPTGFTVELTKAIAREVGLDIEIRLGPWSKIVQGLENGNIDVIQGMFYSPERDRKFDFTQPHTANHYVSVVRKGESAPPTQLQELADKSIVVQEGDIIYDHLAKNGLADRVSFVGSQEAVLRELAEGKHDCALAVRVSALYLIKQHGWENLELGRDPIFSAQYCYAVSHDRKALLALFSEGLKVLEESGEYRRIYDKWLGVYTDESLSLIQALRYSAMVLIPLLLLLLLSFLWSWSLKKQVARRTAEFRRSEEKFRLLVESAPDAIFIQTDERFAYVNQACIRLAGARSISQMVGKPVLDLFHPADHQQIKERMQSLNEESKPVEAAMANMISLRGEEIPVELSAVPFVFEGKNGALFFVRDVGERLRAEKEIAENERRFRRAVQEAPLPVMMHAEDGEVLAISRVWLEITGYEADEISTVAKWTERAYGDRKEAAQKAIRKIYRAQKPLSEGEFEVTCKNGERRVWEFSSTPLGELPDGRRVVFSIAADLTEYRRAEIALRESEERYRLLFESNPNPMWVYDLNTLAFLAVNNAAVSHYGYARDEFLKMSIKDIRPPEDIPALLADVSASKNGIGEKALWKHQKKDGTIIDVEITAHPITWNGRRAKVVLAHDVTERMRAEEALRESQRQLSTLMGNLPGMAYRCRNDPDWTMEFVSEGARLLTGYTANELVGNTQKSYAELIHPQDRQMVWDEVQAALKKKKSFQLVYRIITAGQEEKWVWEHGQGIWDEKGRLIALEGFITDITERKRAEEELQKRLSYERLLSEISSLALKEEDVGKFQDQCLQIMANVLEVSRIYIFEHDHETNTMSNTFEWVADGIASQKEGLQRVPGDEFPWWMDLMKRDKVINYSNIDDIPAQKEKELLRSQGIKSILIVPLNVGGEYYGFIGFDECRFNRDWPEEDVRMLISTSRVISATIQRQQANAERGRLLSAIEQAGEMVVIADPEGAIQYVNPAFERITGYSRNEAIGQNPRILKSGEHDEEFYRNLWETISSGKTWEGRIVNKRKDGTLYTEETTISPVRGASGRIVNYVAVKRDITEQIRLQAQLQQAQKMESIGRLAGGVAHDYNNMLNVIIGYSEMAGAKLPPDSPVISDLNEILKAANRSADITRQLLAFARKQTIAPKVLDLNETVEGALKMLRRLIGEDIDLEWHPDAALWLVKIDPAQVDQILANLCVNARDAIEGVGKITIETDNVRLDEEYCAAHPGFVPGDFAMLAVSDNGHGMDKETQSKIFEPFFTTKGMGKGTGLGMATVYGIVKQNNGFINVYSEPQKGTQVKIYLPRYTGKVTEVQPEARIEIPQGRGETILLVEDDASILQLGKLMLESLGYKVLETASPVDALERGKEYEGKIDLLLTDVVMPEMNGRDLADRLKSSYPNLKVLFMSGYTANVIAHQSILEEGVDFIQKPFSVSDIANKVREVLSRDG